MHGVSIHFGHRPFPGLLYFTDTHLWQKYHTLTTGSRMVFFIVSFLFAIDGSKRSVWVNGAP